MNAESEKLPAKTILVVEDNKTVRTLVRTILIRDNYRVLEAEDAMEAIEKYLDKKVEFGLLVTDLDMPEISGCELAVKAQELMPGLKVIIISGHTKEDVEEQFDFPKGVHFIQKPFPPKMLLSTVKLLLQLSAGS